MWIGLVDLLDLDLLVGVLLGDTLLDIVCSFK